MAEGWLTGLETVLAAVPIAVTKYPSKATQGRAGRAQSFMVDGRV